MKPYEALIRGYCETRDIEIPTGFGRNSPSRYVIVKTDLPREKLVATTWFTKPDVVHYLRMTDVPSDPIENAKLRRILDFKFMTVLIWDGKRLTAGKPFAP